MNPPSLWLPETDQVRLAILGKLGEEANELGKACCRAVIQGLDGVDPETGESNRIGIQDEIADVGGLSALAVSQFKLDDVFISNRAMDKYCHKLEWLQMIIDHIEKTKR